MPDPEQTGDTKSDPPAEEELLGNQEQQELEGRTAEIVAEKPQEQIKDGEDGSALVDQSPAFTFDSNPTQNEETENRDAIKAALLQVNSATRAKDEKKEADAGDSDGPKADTSTTDTRSAEFNAVELCEAAVTPSGSERKDSVSGGTNLQNTSLMKLIMFIETVRGVIQESLFVMQIVFPVLCIWSSLCHIA